MNKIVTRRRIACQMFKTILNNLTSFSSAIELRFRLDFSFLGSNSSSVLFSDSFLASLAITFSTLFFSEI